MTDPCKFFVLMESIVSEIIVDEMVESNLHSLHSLVVN